MAKKKKNKKEKPNEADFWELNPSLHGIINKKNFDYIGTVSDNTKDMLGGEWVDNVKANIKSGLWGKHGGISDACFGLGKNKAVIGIGAGQSFNRNKDVLKYYVNRDGIIDFDNRAFITIAANHQFKPLLEFGIIPDFVLLVDGSDVVYDQLCKDIPKYGQNTTLFAGIHCNPKVLNAWDEQGRDIKFFVNTAKNVKETFSRKAHVNPKKYLTEMGGNVLNGAWTISCMIFRSFVFLGVGNDLSFKEYDDTDEQRKGYYADGDYSTNASGTGTGRDEAAIHQKWAGFTIEKSPLIFLDKQKKGIDRYNIKLDIVGTSHTLWVYKNWLETTIIRMAAVPNNHLHYYNCSEAGILGVMAEKDDDESLRDHRNWYMLDSKCRSYHTATLKDAIEHFEKCKEIFECGNPNRSDAQFVIA